MSLPTPRQLLVSMRPMGFKPPVAAYDPPESVIVASTRKTPPKIAQTSIGNGASLIAISEENQRKSKKSTTYIAHENSCGRPVPTQEAQTCGGETGHCRRQTGSAALIPIQPSAGAADKDRFAGRNAIQSIHEIKKIGYPNQGQHRDQAADPYSMQPPVGECALRNTTEQNHYPKSRRQMYAEAHTGMQMPTVIEKSD